jgi:hypothetical protein
MQAEAAYKTAFVGGVRYRVDLLAESTVVAVRWATPALCVPPPQPAATSPRPTAPDRHAIAKPDRLITPLAPT